MLVASIWRKDIENRTTYEQMARIARWYIAEMRFSRKVDSAEFGRPVLTIQAEGGQTDLGFFLAQLGLSIFFFRIFSKNLPMIRFLSILAGTVT